MNFIKIENKNFGESYLKMKHETGLSIYFSIKKGFSKTYALFTTKYGSMDNAFKINGEKEFTVVPEGIAHFLEHKLFESEKGGNVFEQYAKTGASANANTSFERTAYLFSCTDKFEESFRILLEQVQSPYFTPENVEKEQGIIGQEIRMYEDNPGWQVFFNMLQAVYHEHPVREDIAGTIESISKIDKPTLDRCYEVFYNLNNMNLCVCGDFDPEKAYAIIDEMLVRKPPVEIERYYKNEPDSVFKKRVETHMAVSKPLFNLGFKDNCVNDIGSEFAKRKAVADILLNILAGRSSKLYREMYDSGMINSSFGAYYFGSPAFGMSIFGGEAKEPEAVQNAILTEIKRMRKEGIDKKDFDRCLKSAYGNCLRGFNSVEGIANDMMFCDFAEMDLFTMLETYQNLKFKDVTEKLNSHLFEEFSSLSIVYPKE